MGGGRPGRRGGRSSVAAAAAFVAVVVVQCLAGCVAQPPPTSSPATTTFASSAFCEPLRALSVDAWADAPTRAPVGIDLAAARAHAPASLHPALDTLIDLEKAGVHPGAVTPPPTTGGTAPEPLDRWFAAMSALDDVAARECNVDLTAGVAPGSPPGTAPDASALDGRPAGSSGLTPTDVLALVRAGRPDAAWLGRAEIAAVATGRSVQVTVNDVDDEGTATQVCTDLLAVLPTKTEPPTVTVRNTPGLVVVAGDADGCKAVEHP